jgi:hypothetical protein
VAERQSGEGGAKYRDLLRCAKYGAPDGDVWLNSYRLGGPPAGSHPWRPEMGDDLGWIDIRKGHASIRPGAERDGPGVRNRGTCSRSAKRHGTDTGREAGTCERPRPVGKRAQSAHRHSMFSTTARSTAASRPSDCRALLMVASSTSPGLLGEGRVVVCEWIG